jgi:uncharacterized protein YggE
MRAIFFLIFFAITLHLSGQESPGIIEVTGTASIEVEPDFLDIQIVIEHQGDEAGKVQEVLMERSRKILAYLNGFDGISKVKTDRVSLFPRQNYQSKETIFSARQMIGFRFTDLAAYEEVMPDLLEMGVTGISRTAFGSSKIEALQSQLMQQALMDAREKASVMANTLGQSIGKAIFISDQMIGTSPYPVARDLKFSSEGPSIEGGNREVSQSVRVQFQLN